MSTPDLDQSQPDPSWIMPATGQIVLLCVFGGLAVIFGLYCVYLGVTRRSALPVLLFVAGGISIILEPIADTLGNVQHPAVGQINAFVVDGQPIPWHVLIAYTWYYGWLCVSMFHRFVARTMTPRIWWQTAAGTFAFVLLFEQIPAHLGLWVYYGEQPLDIGWMPVWMAAANMASVIVSALLVYKFLPILTGLRSLLVLVLFPASVLGAHTFAAGPSYMVINADPARVSWPVLELAGVATCGLAALIVWIGIALVHDLVPDRAVAAPAEDRATLAATN